MADTSMEESCEHNKTPKNELMDVVNRQVDAVIGSIYGLFFSANSPEKVSFHDILNKVILLLQAPLTFLLCKKEKNGIINEIYNFNKNPLHIKKIKNEFEKAVKNEGLFRVFNSENIPSDYYLLVLIIPSHRYEGSHDEGYMFENVFNKENTELHDFNNLIKCKLEKILDGNLYEKRFKKEFLIKIHAILKKYENPERYINEVNNYKISSELNESYNLITDKLEKKLYTFSEKGYGLIDKVYEKARLSLSQNSTMPNFILFMRSFTGQVRCKERGTSYNYNIRIIICSQQEEDINYFFEKKKENIELSCDWYLNKYFIEGDRYFSLAKQVNDRFKKTLKENHKEIINILKTPFGIDAYSISDPVFKSGLIHFRNPSVNGGLHRALPANSIPICFDDLHKEKQNDLLRVVAMHHLFKGMSLSDDEYRVMLCPIEINARVQAVIGYVTNHTNSDSLFTKLNNEKIMDFTQNWRNCYHTYTDLYVRLKRNIRTYMADLYISMLADYCAEFLIKKSKRYDNKIMTINKLENEIDNKLRELTCFFSYNGISVKINNNKKEKYEEKEGSAPARITAEITLDLSLTNSSFPLAPGREEMEKKYIDLYEVADKIVFFVYSKSANRLLTSVIN